MPDQKLDAPPKPKSSTMSRRTFLQIGGAAVGGWLISSTIGPWMHEVHGYSTTKQVENIGLSNESRKMMSEIVKFRSSLGLEGLPAEVVPGLLKKETWSTKQEDFANQLPEKNKSYGMRINEVMQILFGSNCRRLVKGVRQDAKWPHGIAFETNSRQCLLADAIHNIPIEKDFTDYVLHEAAGHGSDPKLNLPLPPDILIKTEYGKWMALSQCLSIKEQFLNHPEDDMLPLLKTSIGEMIGITVTKGLSINDLIHEENTGIVNQEIAKIAQVRGKNIENVKFNKKTCREIGEMLINLLQKGQIKFTGNLKKTYTDAMERACVEIYAEMVKYALIYPDLIGNNPNILRGIEHVFSAIQGRPVRIDDLRLQIKHPSKEILDLYALEKTFVTQRPKEQTKPQTLTIEQQERTRQQQEDFIRKDNAFKNFIDRTQIPDTLRVLPDQLEVVEKFAKLVSSIVNRYPMLRDTFAQQYNKSFDPNLHIWEIKKIEGAMNTGFIRNLTASSSVSSHDLGQMMVNISILEKFVNSEAF